MPPTPLQILLVDDDELVRESLGMMLEALGHQIQACTCGEEALDALQGGLRPGLVILDQNMPGIGGFATLEALRHLQPTLPVIFATGRIEDATLHQLQGFQRVVLVPKPFTLEELSLQISRLLTSPT